MNIPISPNKQLTPEGYLLCLNVPLTRSGTFLYVKEELPALSSPLPTISIYRSEEEISKQASLASYQSKSITILHPEKDVNPSNWKKLTVGTLQNVRFTDSMVVGDLLINDQLAIDAINAETNKAIKEISIGYDAEYIEVSPGFYNQTNIYINHIALVPAGRCGTICSIQDHETIMTKKLSILDRVFKKVRILDEAALEELDTSLPSESPTIESLTEELTTTKAALTDLVAIVTALVDKVDTLLVKEEEEEIEPISTTDSAELLAKLAILTPDTTYVLKTKDGLYREALTNALVASDSKHIVQPLLGSKLISAYTTDSLEVIFNTATILKAKQNNEKGSIRTQDAPISNPLAAINAANKAKWANGFK
jgi:hypothetical protein